MRYSSHAFANVNLIVVDARKWNSESEMVIRGATMALLDHLNYHVLVAVSSDKLANQVESLGERNCVDMYFHAEWTQSSDEFLARCADAQVVVFPNIGQDTKQEVCELVDRGIQVILPEKMGDLDLPLARSISLEAMTALEVYKAFQDLVPAR